MSEFIAGLSAGLLPSLTYGAWWFFRARRFTDRVMMAPAGGGQAIEIGRIHRRRGPVGPVQVAPGEVR